MTKQNSFGAFVIVALLLVLVPSVAIAQEPVPTSTTPVVPDGYRLVRATLSAGEDPISSGITIIGDFEDANGRLIQVAFQAEQAWVLWGPNFKFGSLTGTIAGTVGHFKGSPWFGPYLTLNLPLGKVLGQKVSLGTLQWPCLFFGTEPRGWREGTNPEKLWIGYLANFTGSVGPVSVFYSRLDFLDDPLVHVVGASYSHKVNKNFALSASASKNIVKGGEKKYMMYYVGLNFSRE